MYLFAEKSTIVNANRVGKHLKAYTIICAKVPEDWMFLTTMSISKLGVSCPVPDSTGQQHSTIAKVL